MLAGPSGAEYASTSGGRPRQRASTGSRSGLEYKKSALVGGALPVYRRFTRISPTDWGAMECAGTEST
jgi:hypothetical protein